MAGAGVWSYSSAGNFDTLCLGALDQLPCDCSAAHMLPIVQCARARQQSKVRMLGYCC